MKKNKFCYLSVLQGDYGQGFEDLTAEDTAIQGWQKRIKTEKKNYQQNDAHVKSLRIISRREIAE